MRNRIVRAATAAILGAGAIGVGVFAVTGGTVVGAPAQAARMLPIAETCPTCLVGG
ncbi:MAG: hypothetical protein V7637_2221 [Mycobacteriales bacterium]|jgi:hypothetical protein